MSYVCAKVSRKLAAKGHISGDKNTSCGVVIKTHVIRSLSIDCSLNPLKNQKVGHYFNKEQENLSAISLIKKVNSSACEQV